MEFKMQVMGVIMFLMGGFAVTSGYLILKYATVDIMAATVICSFIASLGMLLLIAGLYTIYIHRLK